MSPEAKKYRYYLGDSRRESERLRRQAKVWDPIAKELFDRLQIRKGMRVLEVGPGRGSLHMELRRRVKGPIDAVERSEVFVKHLQSLVKKDGYGRGQFFVDDLIKANIPKNAYDVIFVRWVFLFLPQTFEHVKKLAGALAPGGRLAIQDYFRSSLMILPKPIFFDDLVEAEVNMFKKMGGNINVATELPRMFKEAGLETTEIKPHVICAGPKSPYRNWILEYFYSYMHKYEKTRPFTAAKGVAMRKELRAIRSSKASVFITPTVVDLVARKSKR